MHDEQAYIHKTSIIGSWSLVFVAVAILDASVGERACL